MVAFEKENPMDTEELHGPMKTFIMEMSAREKPPDKASMSQPEKPSSMKENGSMDTPVTECSATMEQNLKFTSKRQDN